MASEGGAGIFLNMKMLHDLIIRDDFVSNQYNCLTTVCLCSLSYGASGAQILTREELVLKPGGGARLCL